MASSFPNDGSFLERFKQLQQNAPPEPTRTGPVVLMTTKTPKVSSNSKGAGASQSGTVSKGCLPNGKLAFSLKQKSRLAVNAIKFGEDDDEEDDEDTQRQAKRSKTRITSKSISPEPKDFGAIPSRLPVFSAMIFAILRFFALAYICSVPVPPPNGEVKKVADKLALFVAKNGRQFEEITRRKNPGNTPFSFLYDMESVEYKYYLHRVAQEEAVLASEVGAFQTSNSGGGSSNQSNSWRQSSEGQQLRYQTPASALYSGGSEHQRPSFSSGSPCEHVQDRYNQHPYANDSVAMMEFYTKKAAQEALRKPPKQSKDEMPPPPGLHPPPSASQTSSLTETWQHEESIIAEDARSTYVTSTVGVVEDGGSGKKGHHMGDYIPPEELEKFLAKCNDAKAAKATAGRAKIQADNVGHRLLSKMGWKEGEGLGSGRRGMADPVQAGSVKVNNLGVGAEQPGEVTAEDDIYEQYKKRMMLGYRFRPNPLNNPRKAYY
ncbi:SURP and G-patch domain-containing protein 1-like protein isoform X2 [Physcomitrium patens]|uniref:SURP and G-patch domain-containing protein 1-like protein n=1 Tax=Physcomitrium patens TaxID=3218 RepID=A0A7I4E6K2_PHYPA|nr:SURP and G-patch domain-containing protein 1-like protein isoform X2 [Physcomitrium patens]|eukprot:XP_024381009.1 SURP and G-patch domain-containing protein 1-like protein isoform X2 [Physcomitrella patens]